MSGDLPLGEALLLLLAAGVFLVSGTFLVVPLIDLAMLVVDSVRAPFWAARVRLRDRNLRRKIAQQVDSELGATDTWGMSARRSVIDAAEQAQAISVIDRMLRTSIRDCCTRHWLVAEALAARHMSEAARHAACQELRRENIALAEMLIEEIAAYPLLRDAPELLRLGIALQAIPPVCSHCPYWGSDRATAPRLCPPAAAMADNLDGVVVEGEVVDDVPTSGGRR